MPVIDILYIILQKFLHNNKLILFHIELQKTTSITIERTILRIIRVDLFIFY